ncbi:MAG TPA: hypothetical protein VK691_01675 [Solirubrobacteraceae bacterium]|jgi:hypothetical protein|nr:hypothetical protein [Solirubrobacteraceae bacterium]
MSAGLTTSDSMFSVRVTPWHGLGAVLDRPPASVAEAIEAAALGWGVVKKPLAVDIGSHLPDVLRYKKLPGYYATVRQDTNEELGVVGERYRIVQNHEAFAFVDQLPDVRVDGREGVGALVGVYSDHDHPARPFN